MDRTDRSSELAFELIGALMQRNNPADGPLLMALTTFLVPPSEAGEEGPAGSL